MMAVLCGAACLLMVPVRIPDTADAPVAAPGEGDTNNTSVAATEASTSKLRAEVADGLRYGMGAEPRRTLLILALILGSSFSVMQIAMPRVVEEDFGRDSGAAGLLRRTSDETRALLVCCSVRLALACCSAPWWLPGGRRPCATD
jgi:hypothetical protein